MADLEGEEHGAEHCVQLPPPHLPHTHTHTQSHRVTQSHTLVYSVRRSTCHLPPATHSHSHTHSLERRCTASAAPPATNPHKLQGHLTHRKHPPPLRPPYRSRHCPAVGSYGGAVSLERGASVYQVDQSQISDSPFLVEIGQVLAGALYLVAEVEEGHELEHLDGAEGLVHHRVQRVAECRDLRTKNDKSTRKQGQRTISHLSSIPYVAKRWSHWHVSLGNSLWIRI